MTVLARVGLIVVGADDFAYGAELTVAIRNDDVTGNFFRETGDFFRVSGSFHYKNTKTQKCAQDFPRHHPLVTADRDQDMQPSEAHDVVREAVTAFNSGRHEDAQRLCEQGLARQPGEPTLNHLLAAILCNQSDFASARKRIDESLTVNPNNAAALVLAGRIARAESEFEAALAYLTRAATLGTSAEILIETARTMDQSGSPAQAREVWRAVLNALPDSAEALARLGRLAWEDGLHTEAIAFLERAAKEGGAASIWFDLGLAKQDLYDHVGAAEAYRRALAMKVDYAEAAMNLGVVLQEVGDLNGAIEAYGAAYRLQRSMFGMIAMALTSAPCGRVWLDEKVLRELLAG